MTTVNFDLSEESSRCLTVLRVLSLYSLLAESLHETSRSLKRLYEQFFASTVPYTAVVTATIQTKKHLKHFFLATSMRSISCFIFLNYVGILAQVYTPVHG